MEAFAFPRTVNTNRQGLTVYAQVVNQQADCYLADTWTQIYQFPQTLEPIILSAYRLSLVAGSGSTAQIRILAAPYGTSLNDSHKIYPFGDSLDVDYEITALLKHDIFIPENHTVSVQVKVPSISIPPVMINLDFLSYIKNAIYRIPT